MKKSIKHLPKRSQQQLEILQELILKYVPEVRMIILFGSFGRGGYVLYDETYIDGIRQTYQSDFDLLVITGVNNPRKIEDRLSRIICSRYDQLTKSFPRPTPPQIMMENVGLISRMIRESQFFFTEIVKEGIFLYNDGKYVLPKAEKLSYRRIKEISQGYYDGCFSMAEGFLRTAYFNQSIEGYVLGSFLLHQACERFYKTILLVFIHDYPKIHKLEQLAVRTRGYSRLLASVFLIDTPEDKMSYKLLCAAYVDARYSIYFRVSKEQYDYMIARTEVLRDITHTLCMERLAYYDEKIREEEAG